MIENGVEVKDYTEVGKHGPRVVMFSDTDDYKSFDGSILSNDVFSSSKPNPIKLLRQLKHSFFLIVIPLLMIPLLMSEYKVIIVNYRYSNSEIPGISMCRMYRNHGNLLGDGDHSDSSHLTFTSGSFPINWNPTFSECC